MSDEAKPYQDHGVAWLSVVGMFMSNFIVVGNLKAFGVIYVDLVSLYEAGEFTTSLASVLYTVSASITSILAGPLAEHIPMRWLVMFGVLLSVTGYLIAAFGPTIYFTILGYGLCVGIPHGILNVCFLNNLTIYWKKRKTIANGIAFSGSSVGTFVFPVLYGVLIETYTVRGALLFAGAFMLQMAIAALLIIKPSDAIGKKIKKADPEKAPATNNGKELVLSVDKLTDASPQAHVEKSAKINEGFANGEEENDHKENNQQNKPEQTQEQKEQETDLQQPEQKQEDTQQQPQLEENLPEKQEQLADEDIPFKDDSIKDFKSLFTNIYFMRHIVMIILSICACLGTLFLLPALSRERGATPFISSLTVTTSGVLEFVSRVSVGFIVDKFHLNKVWFWSVANLLCAGFGFFAVSVDSMYSVWIMAQTNGFLGTIQLPLLSPIMSDYIPQHEFAEGAGLIGAAVSMGAAIGYAIVGETSQKTGTYETAVLIFSFMFVAVAVIGLLDAIVPAFKKCWCKTFEKTE